MIDLVFWSFVVALVPIALAAGSRLVMFVVGPFGPPAAPSFFWPGESYPAPHYSSRRVGPSRGVAHGR